MRARKDRVHVSGTSNRGKDWKLQDGPIDFDPSMRSTMPRKMEYQTDTHVPVAVGGMGNTDFAPKFPGHDFRQPNSDPRETRRLKREAKAAAAEASAEGLDITAPAGTVPVVVAVRKDGTRADDRARDARQKGHKAAPRWNPNHWYEDPPHERAPLQKAQCETWNHAESQKSQGMAKAQDRLMRAVRGPDEMDTPRSDVAGYRHPLNFDNEEYYPGRSLIDAVGEEPGNDFQVRPVHLPDFYNAPPRDGDPVMRMQRLRAVIRQRYAGRPKLVGVFRNCALTKPGFVFPKDLMKIFDQMGIRVGEDECELLIKAVDKDSKGAVTFEEFSDLIYGPRVNVGGAQHEAQERHVRHITKTLVDSLLQHGNKLGRAFCEVDPEKSYIVNKHQFSTALESACSYISPQAIEFLWSAQFPGQEQQEIGAKSIDWRSFMSQLAHFSHDHRSPTPCCVQGRKRQYDLLQRTVALTGGSLVDVDLNRPDQDADDHVHIVADQLCHRQNKMPHKPRDAAQLTEHFVENVRSKAARTERALPGRIPQTRLRELLQNRRMVHQDELVDLIMNELDHPGKPQPLPTQEPLYSRPQAIKADILSLETATATGSDSPPAAEPQLAAATSGVDGQQEGTNASSGGLRLVHADVEAFVATQKVNRDHEVDVESFIFNVYRPPDEKKALETANDGLNRHLRGHRPPRERPPEAEHKRYENPWQALHLMEAIADAISQLETSNGGKVKASKIFKRLDFDGDGYLSLSDLQSACNKYKVPSMASDLHALFTHLDPKDHGSVDIGEFTRNFEVAGGSLLDNMARPIKGVFHEGGTEHGGPVQEKVDAVAASAEGGQDKSSGSRSRSAPPSGGSGGSLRSQMSRVGASIAGSSVPVIQETGIPAGRARISDAIRARCEGWKPHKSEIYTSVPRTRFGLTVYPDTRHITEATVPLSDSYLPEAERFKTTNHTHSVYAVPDVRNAQAEDAMRKHARNEFHVERIRQRQRDFSERCWAANEAARDFDEMKIARKAMNQLNYERKCHMSFA